VSSSPGDKGCGGTNYVMKVSNHVLAALKELEQQEAHFLSLCGWERSTNGWRRISEKPLAVLYTQELAVTEAKKDVTRAQILKKANADEI